MVRLAVLQVRESGTYETLGVQQRVRTEQLSATRAEILDRNGSPLAITLDARDIYANPTLVTDPAGEAGGPKDASILDWVSAKAPALMEAHQLSTKAARVGFDWKHIEEIFDKIQEELDELRAAIRIHFKSKLEDDHVRVREEMGDLLFAVTNVARHLQVEPEAALKLTNRKFRRRFRHIEGSLAAQGKTFDGTTLEDLESLWLEAKTRT